MLPEEQAECSPLPLRARVGPLRLATRPCSTVVQAAAPQARAGREDRNRWAPAGHQGRRPDRRGPRAAGGHAGRSHPPGSPTGPRCSTRGRSSTVCGSARAASRSGSRCRRSTSRPTSRRGARPRRRLRHPRRPRRRHRRRPDDLPGHHQRADHGRAGPGPAAPRPRRRPRRHARRHRRVPARPGHGQGARARCRRDRGLQRRAPGDRLRRDAGVPHRQLPDGHRHPEAAPAGPAAGRSGPRSSSPATSGRSPS